MAFNYNWNRRTFLGTLGALLGTLFSGRMAFALPPKARDKAAPLSGFGSTGNVYEELGVTTVINGQGTMRSEEHTSELQSRFDLVCRLLLEKKNTSMSMLNPHALPKIDGPAGAG